MSEETSDPPVPEPEPRVEDDAKSVLEAIDRATGEAPRVFLREDGLDEGDAPVIDPAAAEKTLFPTDKGNYQVLGEIARGGRGVVLEGLDEDR